MLGTEASGMLIDLILVRQNARCGRKTGKTAETESIFLSMYGVVFFSLEPRLLPGAAERS